MRVAQTDLLITRRSVISGARSICWESCRRASQRDERELELTLALAVSLIAVHGFGSIRVEECAIRAKDLSDKLYGSQNRFAAQRVAWNSSLMRQPVPRTTALATDLVGLAEEDGDPAKLAVAYRALGYSLLIAGQFREAAELLARGAALADTISRGRIRDLRRASKHGLPSLWRAGKNLDGFPRIRDEAN